MTPATLHAVLSALTSKRFPLYDEAVLQRAIAGAFEEAGLEFLREVQLSPHDRIDFLVDAVGVEIKIKGGPLAIYRQLARYCLHERVQAIVLATNRFMGLPPEIEGKPAYLVALGRSWL